MLSASEIEIGNRTEGGGDFKDSILLDSFEDKIHDLCKYREEFFLKAPESDYGIKDDVIKDMAKVSLALGKLENANPKMFLGDTEANARR